MSFLIPSAFRPIHCEAAAREQQHDSQSASPASPGAPSHPAYVIPHLPGEGRFDVSAKVRCPGAGPVFAALAGTLT